MSAETLEKLNTETLIGQTEKRGHAWHYRPELQGDEPNHYSGFIPVDDVSRRLFNFKLKAGPMETTIIDEDGVLHARDETRQVIVRDDTAAILGAFKDGYKIHNYKEWLLDAIGNIIDADLNVASAGLLQGGAVAWVQIETPDTVTGPGGFEYRPFITGFTSANGSLGSGYTAASQAVVCDNTLSANIHSAGGFKIKVKHTRNSLNRIADVREALQIIVTVQDDFDQELEALLNEAVSETRFNRFAREWAGGDKVFADPKPGRSLTMAENKKGKLTQLWTSDPRVEPWRGTALGVVQAVNTFTHHEGIVRGASRFERNMERVLSGGVDLLDQSTINLLASVPA